MKKITIVGNERNQTMATTCLDTGKKIYISLKYRSLQYAWFISIEYEGFVLNNFRVTTSGNFLHQFRNIIPFGFSCVVENNQEPLLQDDFSSGRASIYLLDSSEVTAFSEVVSGQATA